MQITCEAVEGAYVIEWAETGGPEVISPSTTGFGSTLVDTAAEGTLGAIIERDWRSDGLLMRLRIPKTRLEA